MKAKELRQLNDNDREKKLKELKLELTKSKTPGSKVKTKEIRKMIARILTINSSKKEGLNTK